MDGRIVEGLAGAKVGQRWRRMSVYLRVRPGFLHFSKTLGDCSVSLLDSNVTLTSRAQIL